MGWGFVGALWWGSSAGPSLNARGRLAGVDHSVFLSFAGNILTVETGASLALRPKQTQNIF